MTTKQKKILNSALQLFASNGFDGTSTNKIAKEAGVSEGLIFRHFQNKEGLLNAILDLAKEDSKQFLQALKAMDNPKERLKKFIQMPFELSKEQKTFWKLVYALKWQANFYDGRISKPFKALMQETLRQLAYENPSIEAEILLMMNDGVMTTILLKNTKNQVQMKKTLLNKYDLKL